MLIERRVAVPILGNGTKITNELAGSRLRKARIDRNVTIRELSELSGISETSISYIETNAKRASMPSLRIFSKLLNVPIWKLGCFEGLPERTLGEKIRKSRLYKGFTKVEMSTQLNVDVKTLTNWENDNNCPSDAFEHRVHSLFEALHPVEPVGYK
jgi:transcriptional regulator with XRE-family HTH domain